MSRERAVTGHMTRPSYPMMGIERLFVAVPIAEPAKRVATVALATLRRADGLGAVRWVRPESFHVTVAFVGDVRIDDVWVVSTCVGQAARAIAIPPPLSLGPLRSIPSTSRPKVLWIDVLDQTGALGKVADTTRLALGAAGFEIAAERFRPHVTLGRPRPNAGLMDLSLLAARSNGPGWTPLTVDVWSSRTGEGGSTYSVVSRHPFGERGYAVPSPDPTVS